MKNKDTARKSLERMARKRFRGYPIATVAYYGPDNKVASKVAVGIVIKRDEPPEFLKRWFSTDLDVRSDELINGEILEFIRRHKALSVIITDKIIGCPHEEGIDYPIGESCPKCPYWAKRDRWAGKIIY